MEVPTIYKAYIRIELYFDGAINPTSNPENCESSSAEKRDEDEDEDEDDDDDDDDGGGGGGGKNKMGLDGKS